MNVNSQHTGPIEDADDTSPILIVPYMWIGDFVRGHTVVRVLKEIAVRQDYLKYPNVRELVA